MYQFENQFQSQSHRVAVLIDGDNISPRSIAEIVSYASDYGEVTIRKVYDDWTCPSLAGWKNASAEYGFRLEQATAYTSGKNTSDLAIVMEAMDIRYQHLADTVCIASSDGDFTGIAQRLREAGIRALGFGAAKTPQSLVTSCSSFLCAGPGYAVHVPEPASAPVAVFPVAAPQKGTGEGVAHVCQYQDSHKPRILSSTGFEAMKWESELDLYPGRSKQTQPTVMSATPTKTQVPTASHNGVAGMQPTIARQADRIQRDRNLFTNLFLMASGGRSMVTASAVSQTINRKYKDFRLKDYGCKSTAKLYEALGFKVAKSNGKKIIMFPEEFKANSKP